MKRILLGQLCSNGDCLYATTLAHQIKEDFPGCHLVWAISSLTTEVLKNNPDVDETFVVPMQSWADMESSWVFFEREAMRLYAQGHFDEVYLTQISPANFHNYDGTVRSSIFRGYNRPITVPVENRIFLTKAEIKKVDRWFAKNRCSDANYVAIMECSSKSGQSFMTPDLAVAVAERVLQKRSNMSIIISTHEDIASDNPNIISGRDLTMRETARLTQHADLFIGCGSGLTVVATSTAAKPNLPNIQVLAPHTSVYASFRHDFEYFQKSTDHFLEMTSSDPDHLAKGINAVVESGIDGARASFDEKIELDLSFYLSQIDMMLIRRGKYLDAAQSLIYTTERYGAQDSLNRFAASLVTPYLNQDIKRSFPLTAQTIDRYRELFG